MELSDFFYQYPEIYSDDFQKIINKKAEFFEKSSPESEEVTRIPGKTILFKHQEFAIRFFSQYDSLLLFHGTGSGKSCTTIAPTDSFFLNALPKLSNGFVDAYLNNKHSYLSKVHVLLKGDSLKTEFITQLVNWCSNGKYLTKEVREAETPAQFITSAKSAISEHYTIETYGSFINSVYPFDPFEGEDTSDIVLRNIESIVDNSIIIIDEVHNLRLDETENYSPDTVSQSPVLNSGTGDIDDVSNFSSRRQKDIQYRRLHNILHVAKRIKILLLSGTPLIVDPNELKNIINLITPLDKQIPFSFNIEEATVESLEPFVKGKISYVRSVNNSVTVKREGEVFDNILLKSNEQTGNLILYPTTMSDFQGRIYLETPTGVFETRRQEVADFVFPDGSYGITGFKKYVTKNFGDVFQPNNELITYLRDPVKLRKISAKYKTILDLVKKAEGNVFIYTNKVHGSGSIILGLIFENNGYSRFKRLSSKPEEVEPKNRYAIITSSTTSEEQVSIQKIFNSEQNYKGDLLKVIIGSRVTRDGLNLDNITDIHLVSGDWTESSNFQALSRGIRSGSHNILLQKKMEKNPDKDPEVEVKVYRHISVVDEREFEKYGGNPVSVGLLIHSTAEKRDIKIRKTLRLMMRLAVDCSFNRGRNIVSGKDYSQECDYDVCDYDCYPVVGKRDKFIFDSYDVLYSRPLIEEVMNFIQKDLSLNFISMRSGIRAMFPRVPSSYIDMAIYNLIEENRIFSDRFGRKCTIEEVDSGVALVPFSLSSLKLDRELLLNESYYSQILSTVERRNLADLDFNFFDIEGLIFKVKDTKDVENFLRTLSKQTLIMLLERLVIDAVSGRRKLGEKELKILEIFDNLIIKTTKHTSSIEKLKEKLSVVAGKRGRKPTPESLLTIPQNQILILPDKNGEEIWIHLIGIIYSQNKNLASVVDTEEIKDLRILRKKNKIFEWVNGNVFDYPIYKKIFSERIEEIISQNSKGRVNGLFWPLDKDFSILDKRFSDKSTGKNCLFWRKHDVIELMFYLGVPPPDVILEDTVEEMERKISPLNFQSLDPNLKKLHTFVLYFAKWNNLKSSSKDLCSILKKFMNDFGMVIRI